jgi:ATP-dependent helicase/nuclease subunit B
MICAARIFMGWERPAVELAVDWLSRFYVNGMLDLSEWLLVVPTQHAGRRLREELAAWASSRGGAVLGGECVTPDRLAAALDAADPVSELAAWIDVLQARGPDMRALLPKGMDHFTFEGLLGLAERIIRLRGLLCDEGLLIQDVVARDVLPVESERWADLARLELAYFEVLEGWGLKDRCRSRLAAAENPSFDQSRVAVLFVPDLPPLSIRSLAHLEGSIELLVRAPEALADSFDEWGVPIACCWERRDLSLESSQLVVSATPGHLIEQMARVLDEASPLSGVSIGVPDSELLPALKSMLSERGIHGFDPAGDAMGTHPLVRFLELVADYVAHPGFAAWAAVMRHPHLLDYLAGRLEGFDSLLFLKELDQFTQDHLPVLLEVERISEDYPALRAALEPVNALIDGFGRGPLSVSIPAGLQRLYQGRPVQDEAFAEVAEGLMKLLRSFGALESRLTLSAAERLGLFVRLLRSQRRYEERRQESLDLLGWVELAWEDASLLLVAGMHEQAVPESVTGDLFLPDSARSALGLRDNRYLFARDLYMLESVLASRGVGQTLLFTSRTALSGEPMKPSRLLFQCSDEALPGRVSHLFAETGEPILEAAGDRPSFRLKPLVLDPPSQVSVTAFQDYLQCPYRYYLRRVLRMGQVVEPRKLEMDALDYGNMVHGALEALFRSGPHDESEAGAMVDFLYGYVEQAMRRRYGPVLSVPLMIQQESLFQRLRAAAQVQAAQVREGWHIRRAEFELRSEALLAGLAVVGVVDRVDEHEDGRIRLLDYKSFDQPKKPAETHLAKVREDTPDYARCGEEQQWTDLQLPLYALLLREQFGAEIGCGYFVLPQAVTLTGIYPFEEMEGLLPAARQTAEAILRRIKAGVFGPPRERVKYDDFGAIVPFVEGIATEGERFL